MTVTDRRQQRVMRIISDAGALIQGGHFVYTSGDHGDTYVAKQKLTMRPSIVHRLAFEMVDPFMNDIIEAVVVAAVGAVPFGTYAAEHLTPDPPSKREVISVYAEKTEHGLTLRRGYDKDVVGKRCLIVEDVLTTGGTVRELATLVRASSGKVVGVAALWNRGDVTAIDLHVPRLTCMVTHRFPSWKPDKCPLCEQGIPVDLHIGHGRK